MATADDPARVPTDPDRGPTERAPVTLIDVLCVGPILLLLVYGFFGRALTPLLLGKNPVLLEFLRGSFPSIITAGAFVHSGRASLIVAFLAPFGILLAADPFLYWSGRRYGRRLKDYLLANDPTMRKKIARGEKFFARWGAWTIVFANVLPVPASLLYLAAGEVGMPIWLYALADISGAALWIGGMLALGYFIGLPAEHAAASISNHAGLILIGTVVFAIATTLVRQWWASRSVD